MPVISVIDNVEVITVPGISVVVVLVSVPVFSVIDGDVWVAVPVI